MLAGLLLLPLCAGALAEPTPVGDSPSELHAAPTRSNEDAPTPTRIGASLSAGVPSGLEFAPFIRPRSWLQLEAAIADDSAALGLGGGVTVGALENRFTPTFSFGGGHFFRGDIAGPVDRVSGFDLTNYPSARELDFDHLDAQAGILLGSHTLQLFARAGLSWVHTTLHDFSATLRAATGDTTLDAGDPELTAWVPSARVGLQLTL